MSSHFHFARTCFTSLGIRDNVRYGVKSLGKFDSLSEALELQIENVGKLISYPLKPLVAIALQQSVQQMELLYTDRQTIHKVPYTSLAHAHRGIINESTGGACTLSSSMP